MDNENTRIHRRVLSGFAWQGTSKLAIQAISWVGTIVVVRVLSPSDYGVMAISGFFLAILLTLMEMGLSQALIQKATVTQEEENAVFWLSLLLGGALFALLYAIAPLIADFYQIPVLVQLLRLCGLALVISSLKAVPQAILMRRLDFRARALIEVWASLASTGTVVTLALNGFGAWSLAWGMLVQQIVITAGYLPVLKRVPRFTLNVSGITDIIRFGLHLTGANVAYAVSRGADVFLIGKVLGQHFSGIYSLAFQIAAIPLDKIGSVFNKVAFPSLAKVKDDDDQCRTLFSEIHRYLLFICYPALLGMAAVATDLVAVLFGEKWAEVAPILQVLCVVNVVRLSAIVIAPALASRGDARTSFRFSVAAAIVLPLSFLVGVQFGLRGVAIAWILAYPALYAILVRALHRDLGVTLSKLISDSRPTLTATSVMIAAVLAFQFMSPSLGHFPRLAGAIGMGALAYLGVFLVFYKDQVTTIWTALRSLREGRTVQP